MSVYIKSAEAISPQGTFDVDGFLNQLDGETKNYFSAIKPDYKQYILPKMLRRMSKVIRMGVAASIKALKEAEVENPDAIIIGTGLGCLEDTMKFLAQLTENNESLLNPTAFIQSTHNTISGQIALLLGCKEYNFTFSQMDISFETALVDALMLLEEKDQQSNVLLGGVDEVNDALYQLLSKANCVKKEEGKRGYLPGEGANMFVLSNQEAGKTLAKVERVAVLSQTKEAMKQELLSFLNQQQMGLEDIDVFISGQNGDEVNDKNYLVLQEELREAVSVHYKHLVGQYDTASGFAMWLGVQILEKQIVPGAIRFNNKKRDSFKMVLIHHYSPAHKHSYILLSKC